MAFKVTYLHLLVLVVAADIVYEMISHLLFCFHAFIPVRTPEESVLRYHKVLRLVKSGSTKADAYISVGVDRNTIVNQAPIAELAVVNPDMFKLLRSGFHKGHSLQKFADKCLSQCILEPNASRICNMKQANDLLDILKK